MQSYIFIAGGMGITPFRSIIQDLVDKKKDVSILLFYQAKPDEVLFREALETAEKEIGLQTIYITEGKFSEELLKNHAPDFKEKIFYISGPQEMVENYRTMIESLGVPFERIKTDLFTGYDAS